MDINEIFKNIDNLLIRGKSSEAEEYMKKVLSEAEGSCDTDISVEVLHEMAGFYKQLGKCEKSAECCKRIEELLDNVGETSSYRRASAGLNTANAYRACKDLEEAFYAYKKTYEIIQKCGDEKLYFAYYNNLSLLHREAGKDDDADNALKEALLIAEDKLHDELTAAVCRTNLATGLLRRRRISEAEDLLKDALGYFESHTPTDFHYSSALAAYGDLNIAKCDLPAAAKCFEKALVETEKHMGKNRFYEVISDNLESVYKMMGGKPSE